jgi:hypothetical protein
MDAEEFMKYVKSVRFLYLVCSDTKGKRICIKCNMGPGRKDPVLLAWCIQQGVVIYPSVLNTTHVTQEMDQVYGGFKTDYWKSLKELVSQKMSLWTPTSSTKSFSGQVKLSASHVGKIIFGTHANNNEQLVLPNLWSKHFGQRNLLEMWAKVGVVPLTRACLSDKQVQRVLLGEPRKQAAGEAADELVDLLAESFEAADESVDLLAASVEAADASVDLLAESGSGEAPNSEDEYNNYSATTSYWTYSASHVAHVENCTKNLAKKGL